MPTDLLEQHLCRRVLRVAQNPHQHLGNRWRGDAAQIDRVARRGGTARARSVTDHHAACLEQVVEVRRGCLGRIGAAGMASAVDGVGRVAVVDDQPRQHAHEVPRQVRLLPDRQRVRRRARRVMRGVALLAVGEPRSVPDDRPVDGVDAVSVERRHDAVRELGDVGVGARVGNAVDVVRAWPAPGRRRRSGRDRRAARRR